MDKQEMTLRERLQAKIRVQQQCRSKRTDLRKESYNVSDEMRAMISDKAEMSRPKLSRKYLRLYQDYPQIYDMVLKRDNIPETELELLDKMLETREQMREGKISEADAKELVGVQAMKIFHPELLQPSTAEKPSENITITEL